MRNILRRSSQCACSSLERSGWRDVQYPLTVDSVNALVLDVNAVPQSRSVADVGSSSAQRPVCCSSAVRSAMNPEEQTVTWLISLGVLNSPKKNIADPEGFLKASLRDGVVLCKLMERLVPGSITKVTRFGKIKDDTTDSNVPCAYFLLLSFNKLKRNVTGRRCFTSNT